jgi:biopolymer transport protein ExbD
MTPLIDCAFQLIIFFVLVSQFASKSLAHLQLHRPEVSQAIPAEQIETPNRVIVNVISSAGDDGGENSTLSAMASHYEIDGNRIEVGNFTGLLEFLKKRRLQSSSADFSVEIRADSRVNYSDVAPIMQAGARAGIVNMNVTALTAVGE